MNRPKSVPEAEFWAIITGKDKDTEKRMMSFRLSAEARRIIEEGGEMLGDKTKVVELMARLFREEMLKKGTPKR